MEGKQTFYNKVLDVLKQDERFFTQEGELLRNAVYEAAMQMDSALIKALYTDEATRQRFFTDVDGIAVFDKVGFGWVINNKELLPDSYTRYKNKIGLTNIKGELISASNDIELVFPYKDCVLEGGQTKEDQKRSEIFYNETLSPDEKDRLLYPKVFVNAKKYTNDGVKSIVSISEEDNLLVKGNNLLVLSSLLKKYQNCIKLIFVDPPYYFYKTKSSDSFKYNSNFKLSTWLTFCKNRFEIAKDLLSDDGIIAITMGIDGYSHLKLLLDDIFKVHSNPENYIGTISWRKTDNQSNIGDFANVMDYILLYRKSKTAKLYNLPLSDKAIKEYSYEDNIGKYRRANILDLTRGRHNYNITTPDGSILSGPWMISEQEYNELLLSDGIHWPQKGQQIPYGKTYLNDSLEKGQITSDFWDSSYGTNQRAADEIKELFNGRVFEFAKPEKLLMNIITLTSKPGDIVLDFFAGSGTTLATAMKMNRKYIGVEQLDYIETITLERIKKVIGGEQGGVSQDVNWKGGGSLVYFELAKLNQKYVDMIQDVSTDEEAVSILNEILKTGFISFKVNPKEINPKSDEFSSLSIEDKKRLLMELLDKNQLYVNYCDIDDETFNVSEQDKAFTKNFYEGV